MQSLKKNLEFLLFGGSVFSEDDVPQGFEADLTGWFRDEAVFDLMIDRLKPQFVIEVGTWKGQSAFHMVERMRRYHADCFVICIDTWLGWHAQMLIPERRSEMRRQNGYPQLYNQFVANVHAKAMTDHILPIPQTSVQGAELLAMIKLQSPLIYIDASHDEVSVAQDMEAYWPLVLPGGVMMGDDYCEQWPGVIAAARKFASARAAEINGELIVQGDKWVLQKAA